MGDGFLFDRRSGRLVILLFFVLLMCDIKVWLVLYLGYVIIVIKVIIDYNNVEKMYNYFLSRLNEIICCCD